MVVSGTSLLATKELSNDQARRALEQILGSPEFDRASLIGQLNDFIRRLLDNISFNGIKGIAGGLGAWLLALEILIILAGLILIAYLILKVAPFWNIMTKDVKEKISAETVAAPPTPAVLLADAEKKASGGDFRYALRDIYLAILLELDNRRLITCKTTKTNSEYLREISQKAAGLERTFRSLVNLFEFKWYGLEDCAEEDFEAGRELYAALLRGCSHG